MKIKAKLIRSIKTWIANYPSVTLFLYLFGKALSVLPLYQRMLLLTLSLVPWIVFVGVPFVNLIIGLISSKNEQDKSGC